MNKTYAIIAATTTIIGAVAVSTIIATAGPDMSEAADKCGVKSSGSHTYAVTIDVAGGFDAVRCMLVATGAPDQVKDTVWKLRPIDGTQTYKWGGVTLTARPEHSELGWGWSMAFTG